MSTSTIAKPVSPEAAALHKLSLVRTPKSEEARSILAEVGQYVASNGEVKQSEADVKSLSEELSAQRAYLDGLVTYRNRAVRTAQSVGFSVSQITEAFGVSRGTVQNIANATKVRNALKAGGSVNPPSADAILSKVSNLAAGELPTIIEHAQATGELPEPKQSEPKAEPKAPSVKSVLTRAESLSDALSSVDVKATDAESVAQMVRVLESALAKAQAIVVPAEESTAPAAEDYSTDAAVAA